MKNTRAPARFSKSRSLEEKSTTPKQVNLQDLLTGLSYLNFSKFMATVQFVAIVSQHKLKLCHREKFDFYL